MAAGVRAPGQLLMKHVAGPPELAHAGLRGVVRAGNPVLQILEVAPHGRRLGVRRGRLAQQRVLLRRRDADPRLAVLVDRGHVERAERAEKRALIRGRLHREQLVEERPDPGAGRPGDDRLGEGLERLRLMRRRGTPARRR